jgi:hypothetical protein
MDSTDARDLICMQREHSPPLVKLLTVRQVIDAMEPWKNESQFGDFIAEQSTFPTAPPSPAPGSKKLSNPRKADLDSLQRAYTQLQKVEVHLKENGEDVKAIQQLMSFVRGVRKVSPSHTAAQRFEMLNPLRAWLFWLPVMFLQQTRNSPSALVILAHYYTVALVVEPLFPEVGAAYFGSLSLGPIEEIARRLFSINVSQTSDADMQTPLNLMEYPIDMVSMFRSRMGWVQPERTASFPTFPSNSYGIMEDNYSNLSPYGNPAFTYSQEHLMTMPPDPVSATAISPLSLDPFGSHYLGIPSPNGFGGYHSPATSNFGEGSIVYSDQGEDFAPYDGQTPGSNFGGFVLPTVWI